jgi:hypothetical protein
LLWFEFGCFPRPGRDFHCAYLPTIYY